MIQRAFATNKGMVSCYAGDPAFAEFFYAEPYSLYRFRIDPADSCFEAFDFFDNPAILGVGFRTGTLGVICLFDSGLHRRFRARCGISWRDMRSIPCSSSRWLRGRSTTTPSYMVTP